MIMKSKSLLYLSRKDVEHINLSMESIIDAVETVFKEKGEGRTEMPPKPRGHPPHLSYSSPITTSSARLL